MRLLVVIGALVATMVLGTGCDLTDGSEVHLLPNDYTGPVVFVFADPNGEETKLTPEGAVLYEVPPSGMLRLKAPAPEAGIYRKRYYYVRPDGTRQEIPYHADPDALQVFADVVGVTGSADSEAGETTWAAYVVGVPDARRDWAQRRIRAVENALSIPPETRESRFFPSNQ